MPHIGLPELIIILVVILIIFGAGKLPQIGEALGKSLREFRKAQSGEVEKPGKESLTEGEKKKPGAGSPSS